jgi:putative transcriptional regulator
MLDLKVHNKLEPKKGRVLITEPFLDDDYFGRMVILLCDHNEEGSFGFVLNNYVDVTLQEISDFPEFETKLSIGGPVGKQHLYFLHTLADKIEGAQKITNEIYLGGEFSQVIELAKLGLLKKSEIKFFLGYSGWTANQLEGELKQNAWLVANIIDAKQLLDVNNSDLWQQYMKNQGGKYKSFSHFPENPSLN